MARRAAKYKERSGRAAGTARGKHGNIAKVKGPLYGEVFRLDMQAERGDVLQHDHLPDQPL